MRRSLGITFLIVFTVAFVVYLLQDDSQVEEVTVVSVEDANPSSELALHMRAMHEEAKALRKALLNEGDIELTEPLDWILEAEPTDSNVKGDDFESFARYYISQTKHFVDSSDSQAYNKMVESCVACHQQFCPGPVKTIEKLYINSSAVQ